MVTTRVAFLIATLLQAILYGFYLETFVQCLRWLLCEDQGWKLRPRGKVNRAMLIIAVLILILASADTMVALKISLSHLGSRSGKGLVVGVTKLGIVNVRIPRKRGSSFIYLLYYPSALAEDIHGVGYQWCSGVFYVL